ncbi:hypothetical protein [Winogradskyella thalassocola]|uniref:Uncharacterized protein n=1 Tax=Winogradskyella thalassocola TaxID=262004 RepID=A0A1G7XRR7_9FLAO|nr:hypothetical protein [Winogradskyella thalassocola]SDG86889.1 hypothetical protein SAMN04489796_101806 [Winogradskyella thalassocola]
MNKSVRKSIITVAVVILLVFLFNSLVIYNPKSADCKVVSAKIIDLRAGPTYDIQFKDHNGDTYYINRGIESGLNLDSLNAKVLNKTVTLHLPKMIYGPSKHIAQLAIEDHIIYSEFKD